MNTAVVRNTLGAAILLLAFSCMMGGPGGSSGAVGEPAPDFTLPALNRDSPIALSQFHGQSGVVVVFFATWCGPCMREVPHVIALTEAATDHNVHVVAINVREDRAAVDAFLAQKKPNYPVLSDKDGTVSSRYGIRALPTVVGIDRAGVVRHWGHSVPSDREQFLNTLGR